jgi:hypothetical protein
VGVAVAAVAALWVGNIVAQYAYQSPGTRTRTIRTRTRTQHGWHGGAEKGLEGTPPTHFHRQHTNDQII